jgi:hypothetical protein
MKMHINFMTGESGFVGDRLREEKGSETWESLPNS